MKKQIFTLSILIFASSVIFIPAGNPIKEVSIVPYGTKVSKEKTLSTMDMKPVDKVSEIEEVVQVASGSHTDWMKSAGISPSDFSMVEVLIEHESGWNTQAINSSSGACGLVQALPCSKLPNWQDPVSSLRWGDSYVKGRYGSWSAAWSFWQAQSPHWY